MLYKKILLLFILVLLSSIAMCQHLIVVASNHYSIEYEKHPGQLILNSGRTVKGVFQYAYMEFPVPNFKYYSDSGKLIRRYKVEDIKSITLEGADTSISNLDSTYFVKMDRSSLYRQLTFGQIKIYDPLIINVTERPGLIYTDLIIIENNVLKKFHSEYKTLNYIEEGLKQKNIQKSFKSLEEAVRYLNYHNL